MPTIPCTFLIAILLMIISQKFVQTDKEKLIENCDQNSSNCTSLYVNNTFKNGFELILQKWQSGESRYHFDANLNRNLKKGRNMRKQTDSLVKLLIKIVREYLMDCPPIIFYDDYINTSLDSVLDKLLKHFPTTYYHGEINPRHQLVNANLTKPIDSHCKSFLLFLSDPIIANDIIGPQLQNRVVLISTSALWKLKEFLTSKKSAKLINLLAIDESMTANRDQEYPYILYTHKLYTSSLGSNKPIILASWVKEALSRPNINLFPSKFHDGFHGHRFQIMAADQPPFIFRKQTLNYGSIQLSWDGIEYRLINMIANKLNFSIDIIDTPERANTSSPVESLEQYLAEGKSDIGMAGIYVSMDRLQNTDMSVGHSKDCAAFITLASQSLPKYRAILGPFQWPVWLALIFIYLGGVFPIVFTDRLTLSHLLGNWPEIENMFWYVFGMFTNAFTFTGKYSWSHSEKISTRILIGSYWVFTIIVTGCYTGSIIAFVTLPAFPNTIDSVDDLLGLFFRVVTLDSGGWKSWFTNSTHKATARLFEKMEFVTTLEEGISNVTDSFLWNFAFLGSKAQLEYLIQANYSKGNLQHRPLLYLSKDCFALFQIGYMYPQNAVYKEKINSFIQLAQQGGLINKISNDVKWTMQRSSSGKLLQVSSSSLREIIQTERQLTTTDVQGMFLLLGIGYIIGAVALTSEIVGGISRKCRQLMRNARTHVSLNKENVITEKLSREERLALAKFTLADRELVFGNNNDFVDFVTGGDRQINQAHNKYNNHTHGKRRRSRKSVNHLIEDELPNKELNNYGKSNLKNESNAESTSEVDNDEILCQFVNEEIRKTLSVFDRNLVFFEKANSEADTNDENHSNIQNNFKLLKSDFNSEQWTH